MVVMMHSTLGVGEAVGREGFMHLLVAFAKPFRMPDFFMISGLFLSRVIDRDCNVVPVTLSIRIGIPSRHAARVLGMRSEPFKNMYVGPILFLPLATSLHSFFGLAYHWTGAGISIWRRAGTDEAGNALSQRRHRGHHKRGTGLANYLKDELPNWCKQCWQQVRL
jgi:hypothetical protein